MVPIWNPKDLVRFILTRKGLLLLFFGVITPIFLSTLYLFWTIRENIETLEFIKTLLSLFTFMGIAIAIATYQYNRGKDETTEVSNQISFFREKIIPINMEFQTILKEQNVKLRHLDFNTNLMEEIIKDGERQKIVNEQYKISQLKGSDGVPVFKISGEILNLLEEFSARVSNYHTEHHKALSILHSVFVQTVETHATMLFYIREIEYGKPLYPYTLELYFSWKGKDSVNKSSPHQRASESETWKKIISLR